MIQEGSVLSQAQSLSGKRHQLVILGWSRFPGSDPVNADVLLWGLCQEVAEKGDDRYFVDS